MSGKCVERLPHSCGTRQGLQVFQNDDGTYSGYCFHCFKYVDNPYEDKPAGYKPEANVKTEEEIQEQLAEINEMVAHDLPSRKLKARFIDYAGIKVGFNEKTGEANFLAFVHKQGYYCRTLEPKRFWSVGDVKGAGLYGMKQALQTGAKRLFITEGHLDMVALIQVLKENNDKDARYEKYWPAVVSLSHGVKTAVDDMMAHRKDLKKFKEIILCFDMDEPGNAAVEAVCKVFPECFRADLPEKDANACLIEGRSKGLINAVLFNASIPKNTRIVSGDSLHEDAKEPAKFGLSYPWAVVTEATRGIRFGETIYIGAAQKMGQPRLAHLKSL